MNLARSWIGLLFALLAFVGFNAIAQDSSSQDQAPEETPREKIALDTRGITPWNSVIARNWNRWSDGKDSVVKLDLLAKIALPEFRGEDAAALVALEKYLRKVDSVDRATAIALQDDQILNTYYTNVIKLNNIDRRLYAKGEPGFETLKQGPAGDCYFFSGTGWMALYRKEVIMRSIHKRPDGQWRVSFPNGDEAVVTTPTDAELALNDAPETLQDGLWMSILEKATGTIQQGRFARSAKIPDPTAAIDVGGIPPASIVERWTGNAVEGLHLGARADRERVHRALQRMQERRSMAEVLLLRKPAARLMYNHVYAVLGYDASSRLLKVWNPHGQNFTPDGPSGPENGYETRHGIFSIGLDEFIEFFTFLVIEKN